MKILVVHTFGRELGDWNNRLKRQIDLMSSKHYVKTFCDYILPTNFEKLERFSYALSDEIRKSDIVYCIGMTAGDELVRINNNSIYEVSFVYDLGTFKSMNILVEEYGIKNFDDYTDAELIDKLNNSKEFEKYTKEKRVVCKADAIIAWDSKEADLAKRVFGKDIKIHKVSMSFSRLPAPIPFKDKKHRVIAIAAKWGRKNKNGDLLGKVNQDVKMFQIGKGRDVNFMYHQVLMDELDNSKVLYCPYYCGGCGTILEGLRLGCNVVIGGWNIFDTYVNDELIFDTSKEPHNASVQTIKKALKKYYPPKKSLPEEKEQLNLIIKICEEVCKR